MNGEESTNGPFRQYEFCVSKMFPSHCVPNHDTVLVWFANRFCGYLRTFLYSGVVHGVRLSLNCGHQRAYCPSPRWYMNIERYGGMILTGKRRRTRRKTCPSGISSPQIPHGLTWARTMVSAVRGRRLTTWVVARPFSYVVGLNSKGSCVWK
jgi:hypothetical protein